MEIILFDYFIKFATTVKSSLSLPFNYTLPYRIIHYRIIHYPIEQNRKTWPGFPSYPWGFGRTAFLEQFSHRKLVLKWSD